MDYRKFLVLFSVLLAIPIVKADGCGIVCPKNVTDLLTLSLATLCNFFTWGFCHIFAFIILAIIGIVIFIFWRKQPDEKKKTIKLLLYGLFGIFVLVIMYPYIKAWTGMAVSTTTVDYCTSTNHCEILAPYDGLTDSSKDQQANSDTDYWDVYCNDKSTVNIDFQLTIINGSASVLPIQGVTPYTGAEVSGHGGNAYTLRLECGS